MARKCEKNHRCSGSLENEVSIWKNAQETAFSKNVVTGWTLWHRVYDFEYEYYRECMVAKIAICPFCGKRLEEDA